MERGREVAQETKDWSAAMKIGCWTKTLAMVAALVFPSVSRGETNVTTNHQTDIPDGVEWAVGESAFSNSELTEDPAVEPISFLADPCQCDPCSDWSLFAGLAGAKQPQDFGVNAHFGARTAVNYGRAIGDTGLGLQLGTAIVATDNAVQVIERVEGSSSRFQSFSTVGLFQHTGDWHWGAGYDFLYQRYFDDFFLGQWRGQIGYDVTANTQVGLRAQLHGHGDDGVFGAIPLRLSPINQVTGYMNYTWDNGAMLGGWAGLVDGHGENNVALGDLPRRDTMFVFGSSIRAPLTDHLAFFGESNFIFPADTGTVDAYLGLEFYPGGGAKRGRKYRPVLPVASNATFSVDLFR